MTDNAKDFFSYLDPANVICHSRSTSSTMIIAELVAKLCESNPELNSDEVISEVVAREAIFPTVIAPGLAVPHARLAQLRTPLVALATSAAGVDFGGGGMDSVKVVVLLLTPGDDPGLHLQLLSALACDFGQDDTVDRLARLDCAKAISDRLSGVSVEIPDFLRVRDVMTVNPPTVLEQDSLQHIIEIFATTGVDELPVLDDDGDLRGIVSLSDLLRFSMPEHVLWLEDLTPVYRFQPFSEMLKSSCDTKAADVMRSEFIQVDETVPAVQLAKLFLVNNLSNLVVVNTQGKLAGMVTLKKFSARLFWE